MNQLVLKYGDHLGLCSWAHVSMWVLKGSSSRGRVCQSWWEMPRHRQQGSQRLEDMTPTTTGHEQGHEPEHAGRLQKEALGQQPARTWGPQCCSLLELNFAIDLSHLSSDDSNTVFDFTWFQPWEQRTSQVTPWLDPDIQTFGCTWIIFKLLNV